MLFTVFPGPPWVSEMTIVGLRAHPCGVPASLFDILPTTPIFVEMLKEQGFSM
jgi:hypothetical protein